jgi:hypothetical protein
MIENRVTTKEFGTLASDSPLLVPVPTAPGHLQQRVHILVYNAFVKMSEAVQKDLGFPLLVASGWREHRWSSFQQYKDFVTKKYGSLKEGRKWLAFNSAHTTGLALDLGCGGLEPNRATIAQQIKTPLYKWLDKNEYIYGFTDYGREPWHKELHVPLSDYKSGITNSSNLSYVPPVTETNDVCEDNMCIEGPWDLDYLSKLDNT